MSHPVAELFFSCSAEKKRFAQHCGVSLLASLASLKSEAEDLFSCLIACRALSTAASIIKLRFSNFLIKMRTADNGRSNSHISSAPCPTGTSRQESWARGALC